MCSRSRASANRSRKSKTAIGSAASVRTALSRVRSSFRSVSIPTKSRRASTTASWKSNCNGWKRIGRRRSKSALLDPSGRSAVMAQEVRTVEQQTPATREPTREAGQRTPPRPVFMPPADIYETKDSIVVLAEMPGVSPEGALCCTDQQLGEVSPPHRHLFEANVFRPPKLQHTVERRDSNGHLGRLPPFGPRAQRVTNHSLVAADIGFYQGTPIVTRCPLPAHAAALGDQLQVPVALGRRGLCRGAWHRARTWRHNDRRIGMTLADLTVDIVPIVRSIAGKRHNRSRDLLKQGTDLRTVIDILSGQLGGDDLSRVGIHPDMELSPGPTRPCGVLLDEPLTGTAELEPCAVHQQVYRFAARWWSRHRQCLAASAHRRMVWRREIKAQQRKNGCDQPFGLA